MTAEINYREAIAQALADELEADPRVVLIGEDVGAAGGVFKSTAGLVRTLRGVPSPRHADLRAGDRRHGPRRSHHGPSPGGRDHVRRLRRGLFRPDRQPARQVPLHDRGPSPSARHRAHGQWCRRRVRGTALATGRELVPQHSRAQDRRPRHPGRHVRAATLRHPGGQPGPGVRAQEPVRDERDRCPTETAWCRSEWRTSSVPGRT